MNDFGKGFLLGHFFGSNEGDDTGIKNNSGCGVLFLWLLFLVGIILVFVLIFPSIQVLHEAGIMKWIYLIFIGSTWDLYFDHFIYPINLSYIWFILPIGSLIIFFILSLLGLLFKDKGAYRFFMKANAILIFPIVIIRVIYYIFNAILGYVS